MSNVGLIMKSEMSRIGLSQSQLARNVGCGRAMISQILNMKEKPGGDLALRIVKEISDDQQVQQTLAFYLLSMKVDDAIETIRTSGDWEDDTDSELRQGV